MLKIYIDNQQIDTKGISINLKLSSPFFFDQTSFSYNFKIPATKTNREILNYPDYIHNYNTGERLNCYIEHEGFYIDGEVIIKNINKYDFELYFIQNHENIIKQLKETKLTQIDYSQTISAQDFVDAYKGDSTTHSFSCATVKITTKEDLDIIKENVENDTFTQEMDDVFLNYYISPAADIGEKIINLEHTWDDYSGSTYENQDDPNHNYIQKMLSIRCPFWYLSFVIKKMLSDFTIEENIFDTDDMLKGLFLVLISEETNSAFSFKNSLPETKINNFISMLEKYFQVKFVFNFNLMTVKIVTKKSIINSKTVESWENYNYNFKKKGVINVSNYEYSFSEEQKSYFDSYTTGEINKKSMSLPLTTYLSNELWLNDYTEDAYLCYDDSSGNRIYRIFKFPDKPTRVLGENIRKIDVFLEMEKQIPFMLAWQNKNLTDTRIEVFGDGSSGAQQDPAYSERTGENYNFAHWRKEDAHDGYDGYSLDINDAGNYEDVYTRFHKPVLSWNNNLKREVALKIDIPVYSLANFDWLKKRRIGGNNYLIKNITLEITEQRASIKTIQAITTP